MKFRQLVFSLIVISLAGALMSCGSSSKSLGPQMTINLSVLPSSIAEGSSTNVFAIVNNDSNNQGVTWSVSCSGSSCGTLSNTSPNFALYTAPPSVISGPVTVTATSVADSSVTATATFTISAATNLADGTYVYSLSDGSGTYHIAGVFVLNNGIIQRGEQDFRDPSNSIPADRILTPNCGNCVSVKKIANTAADIMVNINTLGGLSETFHATIVNGVHALITEYDGATASGTLDMQTSTAPPSGGYAFVLYGTDSGGAPTALSGILNFDTTSGLDGQGSVFDINDGFNISQDQPIDSATISTVDPNGLNLGRIEIDLTLTTSGLNGIALGGYIVDANHIRFVENNTDPNDVFTGILGGTAYAQGANTGGFSAASPSVAGASYVFGTNGMDTFGPYQLAGVVTLNSDLSASGTLNFNDLSGSGQAAIPFTGTYTIDSTGRVTLNNLTDGSTFNFFLQMYLDGNGNATIISVDPSLDEVAGLATQQTGGGSFTASSFNGTYALDATGWSSGTEIDEIGIIAGDGKSALTGAVDQNAPFIVGQIPKVTVSGTFTPFSSGVFIDGLTGLDVTLGPSQTDVFTYYVIDTTRVVAIETDPNQLTLGYFELKQ